jgi:hypothetical protein
MSCQVRPAGANGRQRRLRDRRQLRRKNLRRRQLERRSRIETPHVPDPQGAVDGRTQDRRLSPGDHLAGNAAAQRVFRADIIEVAGLAEQFIGDTGEAVGGVDPGKNVRGIVALPVDRAIGLFEQRPLAAAQRRIGGSERRRHEAARRKALDGLQYGARRGFAHLVAVEARFLRLTHGERLACPDRPAIHLAGRLQHSDAPGRLAFLNRPVERRRTAIADDPRMHDQAGVLLPDRGGNRPPQIGRDDQLGPEQGDGFFGSPRRRCRTRWTAGARAHRVRCTGADSSC